MSLVREKTDSIVSSHKEAPCITSPYVEVDQTSIPFYINDPMISGVFGGFAYGPKNSYVKDLARKYPLRGE